MEISNITEVICVNNLTAEETMSYVYTPFAKYFVLVIVPLISSFGVFANASFLYMVYRNKDMKTVTNMYLVNLAIADGCLLVAGSVQYLWSFKHSPKLNFDGTLTFESPGGCAIPNMLVYLCYFASIFLVDLVTIERYLAICHMNVLQMSRKRTAILIFFAWTWALLFAGYQIPYFDVQRVCVSWPPEEEFKDYPTEIPVCFHACHWCGKVVFIADLIQYLLSVPAVFFMSGAMVYRLKRSLTRKGTIRTKKSTQSRQNIVRMLTINAFVFFICLTPYEIINFCSLYSMFGAELLSAGQSHYIRWIGRIAMLINSAINPVIYGIVNPSYRRAFVKDCCCYCPNRKRHTKAEYELAMVTNGTRVGNGNNELRNSARL